MRKIYWIILILIIIPFNVMSQSHFDPLEQDLEKQFLRIRERVGDIRKIEINDSIQQAIDRYASSNTIFRHRFENIRFLGQLISSDSLVKLITWNLLLDDGTNNYYCYLITRNNKSETGKLIKFTGKHRGDPLRTDTTYTLSDWYGALYYDMNPFLFNGFTRYILLGIDYGNSLTTRKVIDVLTISQDGGLRFGLNCFISGKAQKYREVFEYAPSAVMSLKFESDKSIVFDHLSPFSPEMKGNFQYYGPDFSFDSYNFEKGFWIFKSDIDIRNKEIE